MLNHFTAQINVAQTEETPATQKANASNARHHLSLEKRRMSLALYVFCYIVFLNGYKTIFALLTQRTTEIPAPGIISLPCL